MADVPPFNREALITALRIDRAGKGDSYVESYPAVEV